jgi:ribonuclease R
VLDRILAQERRLQFSIVEEGIPLTGKKPGKASGKGPRPPKARKKASLERKGVKARRVYRKGRRK